MNLDKIKSLLLFCWNNFGPLLVFYATNHFFGLKPAILVSTLFSISEILWKRWKKHPTTALFKFSSLITLVFGVVDLYAKQPFLLKYEACITNILTAGFFGASLFREQTVIEEFVQSGISKGKPLTKDRVAFFRIYTWIWCVYFIAKAAVYFWIAGKFKLEQGLVIRTLLGSGSLYGMIFMSTMGGKRLFLLLKKWNLLPNPEIA